MIKDDVRCLSGSECNNIIYLHTDFVSFMRNNGKFPSLKSRNSKERKLAQFIIDMEEDLKNGYMNPNIFFRLCRETPGWNGTDDERNILANEYYKGTPNIFMTYRYLNRSLYRKMSCEWISYLSAEQIEFLSDMYMYGIRIIPCEDPFTFTEIPVKTPEDFDYLLIELLRHIDQEKADLIKRYYGFFCKRDSSVHMKVVQPILSFIRDNYYAGIILNHVPQLYTAFHINPRYIGISYRNDILDPNCFIKEYISTDESFFRSSLIFDAYEKCTDEEKELINIFNTVRHDSHICFSKIIFYNHKLYGMTDIHVEFPKSVYKGLKQIGVETYADAFVMAKYNRNALLKIKGLGTKRINQMLEDSLEELMSTRDKFKSQINKGV